MKIILFITAISIAFTIHAQAEIDPSSNLYSFKMKPFSAEYAQMGSQLKVDASLSADGTIYNISMSMPGLDNRSRLITDVIGISAKDGSFVYRDFHLPLPSWTFNRVVYEDSKVTVESFSSDGVQAEGKESSKPVFDGTFAYWQLAGLDPSIDSFVLNRWKKTPQELVVGMSTVPFLFEKEQQVTVGTSAFNCRVYTVEIAPETKVICYVSDQAPYLIKQEYQQGGGDPTAIMTLTKIWK